MQYPEIHAMVATLGGARVLRSQVGTVAQLASRVREGLPVRSLYALSGRFPGAFQSRVEQLVAARTTLQRRGMTGTLSFEESERLERLARITTLAEFVWESREKSQAWLITPHALLDGTTPIDCAASELGARLVEDILWSLEYSLPV